MIVSNHNPKSEISVRLLDRYVLRNFFEPFLICFFGFVGIWLVFDLRDNIGEFIEYHTKASTIIRFYLTQLPAVAVLSIPVGLLLALLFSLSKMSRHNEIISMLTAGRSLYRVLMPLIIVGVGLSAICFELNTEMAPHAEAIKKRKLDEITRGEDKAEDRLTMEGYLFRDRQNNRTWFVRKMRPGSNDLDGVHITQQDADGKATQKWYALRATYHPADHSWILLKGMIVDFNKDGEEAKRDGFKDGYRVIKGWTETPWRIASGQMEAQNLSIPELREFLKYNGDFPDLQLAPFRTNLSDRFAFPLSCLVVVFIAAPLGIVFTRRGVLASVASSIFIFFAMIMLRYFCLALGKGSHMNPALAAWLPDMIFFSLGLILLYVRSSNRELPKLIG